MHTVIDMTIYCCLFFFYNSTFIHQSFYFISCVIIHSVLLHLSWFVLLLSSVPVSPVQSSGIFFSPNHQQLAHGAGVPRQQDQKDPKALKHYSFKFFISVSLFSLPLPPSCMALWGLAVVRKWRHVEIMHRGLELSVLNTSHHHHSLFSLLSLHFLAPARVFKVQTKTHMRPEQKREWKWDELGLFCHSSCLNKTIRNEITKSL